VPTIEDEESALCVIGIFWSTPVIKGLLDHLNRGPLFPVQGIYDDPSEEDIPPGRLNPYWTDILLM